MGTVNYLPGVDVSSSNADIIVNTVNCVSIMGKGVALDFKNRFGNVVMAPYRAACASRIIRPGTTTLFMLPDRRYWAALATKDHWSNKSTLSWVETGLDQLASEAKRVGAKSVALPPPGCSNGGLTWHVI